MSRYYVARIVFLTLLIGSLSLHGTIEISRAWYIILIIVYVLINAAGSIFLSAQYYTKVKTKGENPDSIAVTFDDGPLPVYTERVLDILQQHKVRAAFFCIGRNIAANPDILKRIDAEGHLIGNHSYSHTATFDLKSTSMVLQELKSTDGIIHKNIGRTPKYFRPPFGVTNPMVAKAAQQRNYTVIGWSIRSLDTVIKNPEKLLARITKPLQGGDIILFHDHSESMISILPAFLEHVSKIGLKVVRIDELLKEKAYA